MNEQDFKLLIHKIDDGEASLEEKDKYMEYLRNGNSISEMTYKYYKEDRNDPLIINAALIIGGAILFGWRMEKMLKKSE